MQRKRDASDVQGKPDHFFKKGAGQAAVKEGGIVGGDGICTGNISRFAEKEGETKAVEILGRNDNDRP